MSNRGHTVSVPPDVKGEIAEVFFPAEGGGCWGVSEYDTDCHRKVESCLGLRMLYLLFHVCFSFAALHGFFIAYATKNIFFYP